MSLLLFFGCTTTYSASPVLEPTLTANAEAGTFATVMWTTEGRSTGSLEYGIDQNYGQTLVSVDSDDGRTHTVKWFGTPAGSSPHWRVTSEGDEPLSSADVVFDAPFPPAQLTTFDGEVSADAVSGFLLTATLPRPEGALIVDAQNQPVWWSILDEGREVMQTRLSADGQAVLLLDTSTDYLAGDALLHRVPLDGSAGWTLPLPEGHHDFRELEDGRFLYLSLDTQEMEGATVAGDALVAIDTAGVAETMWSAWGTMPTDTIEPKNLYPGNFVDWTHCNSFDIDPVTGFYWISAHNLSALVVVDPNEHRVRWQIGGTHTNVAIEGGGFDQQHSPATVPGGFLLFDNGASEAEVLESEVLEFAFDDAAGTATRTWSYQDPDHLYATFFGNAERLPNGNTLASWGAAGRISEVTPAGEQLRRFDAGLGTAIGFVHSLGLGLTVQ